MTRGTGNLKASAQDTWRVAQGFIGYMQYLLGVPELLVGVHVLGAVLVWVSVLEVALAASSPVPDRPHATGILTQA